MGLTREVLSRIIARKVSRRFSASAEQSVEFAFDVLDAIDDAMLAAGGGEDMPVVYDEENKPKELPKIPQSPSVSEPLRGDVKGKRLIAMPGEADFNQTAERTGERKIIKAIPLSGLQRRKASNVPDKEWWLPETLIKELEDNFPSEIKFVPDGMPEGAKEIRAVRNIVQQVGLGTVNLEYKHPAASDDLGSIGTEFAQGVVKIPLIAKVAFSVYQKELDIDASLENIVAQLKGLYRPRSKTMIPMVMGEDVIPSLSDAAATDTDNMRIHAGWQPVKDPVAAVVQSVTEQNRQDSPLRK